MKISDNGITVDCDVLRRAFNPLTRAIDFQEVFAAITVNPETALGSLDNVLIEGKGSSAILYAIYNPNNQVLVVKFRESISAYRYRGVSLSLAFAFAQAESKGEWFHRNIKNRFVAEKV